MKKMVLVVLFSMAIFSTACNNESEITGGEVISQDSREEVGDVVEEEEASDVVEKEENLGDTLGSFKQEAILEETIIYDENEVKITATGLTYNNYNVALNLTIENNSDKKLSFISGSYGYSWNSINGYMMDVGYLNCDVMSGKIANDTMSFRYDELMLLGIHEIADLEIAFDISDEDRNHIYSGPIQITTSIFEGYDYGENYYEETITSQAAMNTYEYDMQYFSKEILYEENGVKLLSAMLMVGNGKHMLLLEMENTTESKVAIRASNLEINGLLVTDSSISYDTINPLKKRVVILNLSSILEAEYWEVLGIAEVGQLSMSLSQRNSEGEEIVASIPIEVNITDAMAFDASGEEVYHQEGVRIITKGLLEDPSEYSNNFYVVFLVENTRGEDITISVAYDSVSVNNIMSVDLSGSIKIGTGCSAVYDVELWHLDKNNISSIEDIKSVEIGFEIREGREVLDNPVVELLFEE